MNLSKGGEATLSIRSGGRPRKKLGRFFCDFEGKSLSGFGGLTSIFTYMNKVGFEEAFSTLDLGYKPSVYPVPRILSCLTLGMIAGYAKVRETARLRKDVVLRKILGCHLNRLFRTRFYLSVNGILNELSQEDVRLGKKADHLFESVNLKKGLPACPILLRIGGHRDSSSSSNESVAAALGRGSNGLRGTPEKPSPRLGPPPSCSVLIGPHGA